MIEKKTKLVDSIVNDGNTKKENNTTSLRVMYYVNITAVEIDNVIIGLLTKTGQICMDITSKSLMDKYGQDGWWAFFRSEDESVSHIGQVLEYCSIHSPTMNQLSCYMAGMVAQAVTKMAA
ncbi:MAG: hypothetical protein WCJ95_22565 [Mariniphaga sp.]